MKLGVSLMFARPLLYPILGLSLLATSRPWAADPAWYVRESTWQDTMKSSLVALSDLRSKPSESQFEPFVSEVLRARQVNELWGLVRRDFPVDSARQQMRWEREDGIWRGGGRVADLAQRYAGAACRVPALAEEAARLASNVTEEVELDTVRRLYHRSRRTAELRDRLKEVNLAALRRAITDLSASFPERYPRGNEYLARLEALERSLLEDGHAPEDIEAILALRREALLANPLLDFDHLLVVKRRPFRNGKPGDADSSYDWDMGFPRSSMGN